MSPPGRPSRELKEMMDKLETTLGSITTDEQIALASRFNAKILRTTRDKVKGDGWENHLRKKCDRGRAWAEIMIYRAMGQSASFFIHELKDDPTFIETVAIDELEVCTLAFLRILVEGRLEDLENLEGFNLDFPTNAPVAEKFYAYMVAYQLKKGFPAWNYEHIVDMRYNLYKIIHREPTSTKRSRADSIDYSLSKKPRLTLTPSSYSKLPEEERSAVTFRNSSNKNTSHESRPNLISKETFPQRPSRLSQRSASSSSNKSHQNVATPRSTGHTTTDEFNSTATELNSQPSESLALVHGQENNLNSAVTSSSQPTSFGFSTHISAITLPESSSQPNNLDSSTQCLSDSTITSVHSPNDPFKTSGHSSKIEPRFVHKLRESVTGNKDNEEPAIKETESVFVRALRESVANFRATKDLVNQRKAEVDVAKANISSNPIPLPSFATKQRLDRLAETVIDAGREKRSIEDTLAMLHADAVEGLGVQDTRIILHYLGPRFTLVTAHWAYESALREMAELRTKYRHGRK